MSEENKRTNPHDKFFREVSSNPDNARSFLQNALPGNILALMELESLEICKDSFIETDLRDYFSDMLYKVNLSGSAAYVYVLFEHKSYYDKYVHLQLLEYMVKIWRLFLKQQNEKKKKPPLPIVLPLLIYHGEQSWPTKRIRFSSLLSGPVEEVSEYIPDFSFSLYDLTRFSDDEIKGTVMARVMQLLFKHIFDPDLLDKLPEILSLMRELMKKDTGPQYLETIFLYLSSAVNEVSTEKLKGIVEQAFSGREGEYIMTLAEKLRMEGKLEGEIQGEIKGLRQAIELGMTLKFPDKIYSVMAQIMDINDINLLVKIKDTIKTARDDSEILALLK
jgi:predicted transposase/invertase (TIGR01784 family)